MTGPVTRTADLTIHATITVTEAEWENGGYYGRICDLLDPIGVHVTTSSAKIREPFPASEHVEEQA